MKTLNTKKHLHKHEQHTYPIERPLMLAGLALVLFGALSSIFYAYTNRTFIEQSLNESILYLNDLLLLGGGFAIGFAVTRKSKHKIFSGVVYALLAFMLNAFFDAIRVISNRSGVAGGYPFGLILFESVAFVSLIAVLVIALFVQLRPKYHNVGQPTKKIFIGAFAFMSAFPYLQELYYRIFGPSVFSSSPALPGGLIILEIITNPITLAVIAFFLFWSVKPWFERLFYATFIGSFAHVLIISLFNFRTDAYDPTNKFESAVLIITALVMTLVLWRARKAVK